MVMSRGAVVDGGGGRGDDVENAVVEMVVGVIVEVGWGFGRGVVGGRDGGGVGGGEVEGVCRDSGGGSEAWGGGGGDSGDVISAGGDWVVGGEGCGIICLTAFWFFYCLQGS